MDFKTDIMKKILLLGCMFLCGMAAVFGQAKKPRLMVVPSDIYCQRNGFISDGVPDYRKAFATDPNLRLVISELSTIMAKRDYPLESLEQALKNMGQRELERSLTANKDNEGVAESDLDKVKRLAGPDIILDLDFTIQKSGPRKYISFNLQGIDAYTGLVIAAASGDGAPSTSSSPGTLLEEAVLNYMDNFNTALIAHFGDLFENGRSTYVEIQVWNDSEVNLDSSFDFMDETVSLGDVIEYWMSENCVNGRFSRLSGSENQITYSQVRIPLYKKVLGKERPIDVRGFIGGLNTFLSRDPFNLDCKIIEKGLGEVRLVIGTKK